MKKNISKFGVGISYYRTQVNIREGEKRSFEAIKIDAAKEKV